MKFRKVSLDKCLFLETDLTQIKFLDVTWANQARTDSILGQIWRLLLKYIFRKSVDVSASNNAIYDESNSKEYELIAESYRQLQANYIENYRYRDAGAFHVGEQEMMRKMGGGLWQQASAWVYRQVSYYGESSSLPLAWLGFVLLLFPALILWTGTNTVKYAFTLWPSDCLLITGDYWTTFFDNIAFLTFNRSDLTDRLLYSFQKGIAGFEMVAVVTFITFFLLALRRQFKRKSF